MLIEKYKNEESADIVLGSPNLALHGVLALGSPLMSLAQCPHL